jgi:hypothetical protein
VLTQRPTDRDPPPQNDTETRSLDVLEPEALQRLARIPKLVTNCVNDMVSVIYLGARGRPRCVAYPFEGEQEPDVTCFFGGDAIVDALRRVGGNVRYDRHDTCPSPHTPTDGSFRPMNLIGAREPHPEDPQIGHDGWTQLYDSDDFVDWLLAHRLQDLTPRGNETRVR